MLVSLVCVVRTVLLDLEEQGKHNWNVFYRQESTLIDSLRWSA